MSAVTPIRPAAPGSNRSVAVRQAQDRAGLAAHPLRAVDEKAEVLAIIRSTVQASMEVLAGIRPVQQLSRRLDPRCLAALQHRASLIRRELARSSSPSLARLHKNSVVRSVRLCEAAPGIYEASAVVVDDVRARAVAVRLERSKEVWRVTELVIG
ncbi:MAG TPA: Rv3235 family protein [Arthrobacter sp.]|nr:Rv3235 family protein [Arthrobacter sp.]